MLSNKLHEVLADSCVLFTKTQNYHWNVEGVMFKSLHEMFEEQYNDLFKAIDVLAEIIRTLKVKTDGTWQNCMKLTKMSEGDINLSASDMVKDLLRDQIIIQRTIKEALVEAKAEDNEVVISFLSDRLAAHSKNAWMLDSSLQ